jgi:hypothetical protein
MHGQTRCKLFIMFYYWNYSGDQGPYVGQPCSNIHEIYFLHIIQIISSVFEKGKKLCVLLKITKLRATIIAHH